MKFGVLLSALRSKGRGSEADAYEKEVTAKFTGVLSPEDVLQLDVDEIASVLSLVNEMLAASKPSGLDLYVADLASRGFSVSIAEKYRHG